MKTKTTRHAKPRLATAKHSSEDLSLPPWLQTELRQFTAKTKTDPRAVITLATSLMLHSADEDSGVKAALVHDCDHKRRGPIRAGKYTVLVWDASFLKARAERVPEK